MRNSSLMKVSNEALRHFLIHDLELSVLAMTLGGAMGFLVSSRGTQFDGLIAFGWVAVLLVNLLLWGGLMLFAMAKLMGHYWRALIGTAATSAPRNDRQLPVVYRPMIVHERLMAA